MNKVTTSFEITTTIFTTEGERWARIHWVLLTKVASNVWTMDVDGVPTVNIEGNKQVALMKAAAWFEGEVKSITMTDKKNK